MELFVSQQALVFLLAVPFGIIIGFIYDIFRIIRLTVKCGIIFVFIQDLLYFTVCALLTFLYVFYTNSGDVRFFIILGEIIGAVLYFSTIGVYIMKVSSKIITQIKRFFKFIFKIISKPFVIFAQFIYNHLSNLHKLIKNYIKRLFEHLQNKINCYNNYIKSHLNAKRIIKRKRIIKEPIKESVRKKL